jgi:hypothetical protein
MANKTNTAAIDQGKDEREAKLGAEQPHAESTTDDNLRVSIMALPPLACMAPIPIMT